VPFPFCFSFCAHTSGRYRLASVTASHLTIPFSDREKYLPWSNWTKNSWRTELKITQFVFLSKLDSRRGYSPFNCNMAWEVLEESTLFLISFPHFSFFDLPQFCHNWFEFFVIRIRQKIAVYITYQNALFVFWWHSWQHWIEFAIKIWTEMFRRIWRAINNSNKKTFGFWK